MADYSYLRIPSVHNNGSGKKLLLDQLVTAMTAVREAQRALAEAAPHERDYYLQPGLRVFGDARDQHHCRLQRLGLINEELEHIALKIDEQGSRD